MSVCVCVCVVLWCARSLSGYLSLVTAMPITFSLMESQWVSTPRTVLSFFWPKNPFFRTFHIFFCKLHLISTSYTQKKSDNKPQFKLGVFYLILHVIYRFNINCFTRLESIRWGMQWMFSLLRGQSKNSLNKIMKETLKEVFRCIIKKWFYLVSLFNGVSPFVGCGKAMPSF